MLKTLPLALVAVTGLASGYLLALERQAVDREPVVNEQGVTLSEIGRLLKQERASPNPVEGRSVDPGLSEQLRSVIREELTWALGDFAASVSGDSTPVAVACSQPEQTMSDPDGENFAHASSFLQARIQTGSWTAEDARHLHELAGELGDDDMKVLLDTLFTAANSGLIDVDPGEPLL